MVRRTRQEADATREALLDAAEQVFLERGVARASLDEVARVAGCTRGAVHWHFGDKLGLFLALDERLVLLQDAACQKIGGPDQAGSLAAVTRGIIEALEDLEHNPGRRRLLTIMLQRCEFVADMAPALLRRRAADASLRARLEERFREAEARGELSRHWTPERAAMALRGMMSGLVMEWLRGEAGFTLSGEAAAAIRGLMASIAARPAEPTAEETRSCR